MDKLEEAAWRGEVSSELRHISCAMRQMQADLGDLRANVAAQMDEHRAYHAANETRWGPLRWCERHPIRLMLISAGAAALITLHQSGADLAALALAAAQCMR